MISKQNRFVGARTHIVTRLPNSRPNSVSPARTVRSSSPVRSATPVQEIAYFETRGDFQLHGFRSGSKSVRAALYSALTGALPPASIHKSSVVDAVPRFLIKDYPNGALGPLLDDILERAEGDFAANRDAAFTYAMQNTTPGSQPTVVFYGSVKPAPGQDSIPLEDRAYWFRVNPKSLALAEQLGVTQTLNHVDIYLISKPAVPTQTLALDLRSIFEKLSGAFRTHPLPSLETVAQALREDNEPFKFALQTTNGNFDVSLKIVADEDYARVTWALDPADSGLLIGTASGRNRSVRLETLPPIYRPLQITIKGSGKSELIDPIEISLCSYLGRAAHDALQALVN